MLVAVEGSNGTHREMGVGEYVDRSLRNRIEEEN